MRTPSAHNDFWARFVVILAVIAILFAVSHLAG
jgi:hypothetical protein